MKPFFEIDYYHDYISAELGNYLLQNAQPVKGVPTMMEIGCGGGLETPASLKFLSELYLQIKDDLKKILAQRRIDRKFIDERTHACCEFNSSLEREINDPDYKTIIGLEDHQGRIILGPSSANYSRAKNADGTPAAAVAKLPEFLQGPHVTLFGPPDNAKLAMNAMNSYHRKIKNEPKIVEELLKAQSFSPMWGADDEDSKTPMRKDLIEAGVNLAACFDGSLKIEATDKNYALAKDHLALPIKRFPGLALPCTFLFQNKNPLPLHLYDFALHLYKNWNNPRALVFYVPKLENEEEAAYISKMIARAEALIQTEFPTYVAGSVRLMIVLENPRAIVRVNEIIDNLYPYFVGASLGWHDFLASTARIFKEDSHYRIPVKADPNIVIKYIKASHHLLANVVGERGGIKVGGMYGILPLDNEPESPSFQMTLLGFIKDVITQLKRNLTGFWVAHPDFVRLGLALVEAWRQHTIGKSQSLDELVKQLLIPIHHDAILNFIHGPDIEGLSEADENYVRSLIVADIKESDFIANNHPDEIRYNIFQSLQYLTDWLLGNGCVALPAKVNGVSVRVMDDLATAERSRWEVWHELYHGRFPKDEFIKIVHEEIHFIRKDLSRPDKIVQVKWTQESARWYPVAVKLMLQLMTDRKPVEFATELLLPFTIESIRISENPWTTVNDIMPGKYQLSPEIERLHYYFEICGSLPFSRSMAQGCVMNIKFAKNLILSFTKKEIIEAAYFHGNIGEAKKSLDSQAADEQQKVLSVGEEQRQELLSLGDKYLKKFGFKFLISAKDKTADEILSALKSRLERSFPDELNAAREALWEITRKRLLEKPPDNWRNKINELLEKHKIIGASVSINNSNHTQTLSFGDRRKGEGSVQSDTLFELASLSKPLASAFCLEYFKKNNIPLDTPVNLLFKKANSDFRLSSDLVLIQHLLNHTALNGHYVQGHPLAKPLPSWDELLKTVRVINEPGKQFNYSGSGFLVLEHLIESLTKKKIQEISYPFFAELGLKNLTFNLKNIPGKTYACGYFDNQQEVPGTRLQFPAFAAGALGSSSDMAQFLVCLTDAYQNLKGSGSISHDTAVQMLYGQDKGSVEFIGAKMGLGIFIGEAGENKIALHQGANEGFRSLFMHCFSGPDQGKGFVIFANGDNGAVPFIAEVAHGLIEALGITGIFKDQFRVDFNAKKFTQEQIVNKGYKSLIFDAFQPCRPEAINEKGPLDVLAKYNLAVDAQVVSVTAERFARAENLFSPFLPIFDPQLFCAQGKVMDSWESERHNPNDYHTLEFKIRKAAPIRYIQVSTQFHDGNQVEAIEIFGYDEVQKNWELIVPKKTLIGHGVLKIRQDSKNSEKPYQYIKVNVFPDGGLSRLGLYSELPENRAAQFRKFEDAHCTRLDEVIPRTQKPLTIPYSPSEKEIEKNLQRLQAKNRLSNWASAALGARVVSASNQHYGPAVQVISPFPPIHMFDGFESARSRTPGHFEELILKLGQATKIRSVVLDFKYFVNNNPVAVELFGLKESQWLEITPKTSVKAFAGNKKEFIITNCEEFEQLKVCIHPDGGVHRIIVY